MRNLKNAIFRLQSRVASLRKALLIIIDDDEAMALMNLSLLRAEPELYTYVLYSYFICISSIFMYYMFSDENLILSMGLADLLTGRPFVLFDYHRNFNSMMCD